jgi:protein-S-isoprenylcysteine O-methyltransferase Ste14
MTESSDLAGREAQDPGSVEEPVRSGIGAVFFSLRGLPGLALAAAIVARYLMAPPPPPDRVAVLAGLVALGGGEAMRLWSRRYIGRRSSTKRARVRILITGGPFALVRNPIYIGNIGLAVGFPLLARLPWLAALSLVAHAIVYGVAASHERDILLQQHPDDGEQYVRSVPAWIPRPGKRCEVAPSGPVPWSEVLMRERNVLLGVMSGVLLLVFWI